MKQFEYKTLEFEPSGKWIKSIKMDSSELEVQLNDILNVIAYKSQLYDCFSKNILL